jgi:hypothetical protein
MLSIHDGQQPEPSAGGIAGDGEMPGGSGTVPSSARRANLRVSTRSQGTNGGVSGG